jgi:GT2 family glycosyltransferase
MEERFPGVRFIRLPRNFGLTKALNLGLRAAEADLVFFLSPDIEITPGSITLLADTLETQLSTGAVCPVLLDTAGNPVPQISDLPSPSDPDPELRPGKPGESAVCVSGLAILFRSFFLRALRKIDECYGDYGSSIELCQQVRRANKTILIHPTATAIVHGRAAPLTGAQQADREIGIARFLRKHVGFVSGLTYQLGRALAALFSLRLAKFAALVSQKKIDGT